MDVTVAIATFGSSWWEALGEFAEAAVTDVPVVRCHSYNLTDARNDALAEVETPWVCFLDADDELEPGYFEAMELGVADVRAPAVRYIRRGRPALPYVPQVAGHTHACTAECLPWGNWLVIGSVAPTDLVRHVGGFREFPAYEDWDLWLRLYQRGATFESIPTAVYRAHVRDDSRNRGGTHEQRLEAHRMIARANGVPVPA